MDTWREVSKEEEGLVEAQIRTNKAGIDVETGNVMWDGCEWKEMEWFTK